MLNSTTLANPKEDTDLTWPALAPNCDPECKDWVVYHINGVYFTIYDRPVLAFSKANTKGIVVLPDCIAPVNNTIPGQQIYDPDQMEDVLVFQWSPDMPEGDVQLQFHSMDPEELSGDKYASLVGVSPSNLDVVYFKAAFGYALGRIRITLDSRCIDGKTMARRVFYRFRGVSEPPFPDYDTHLRTNLPMASDLVGSPRRPIHPPLSRWVSTGTWGPGL